jgi:hypothetical protein
MLVGLMSPPVEDEGNRRAESDLAAAGPENALSFNDMEGMAQIAREAAGGARFPNSDRFPDTRRSARLPSL